MRNIKAQIIITNKELEGVPCSASASGSLASMTNFKYCSIPSFFICEGYVEIPNNKP